MKSIDHNSKENISVNTQEISKSQFLRTEQVKEKY